jgi:hypothetical protein
MRHLHIPSVFNNLRSMKQIIATLSAKHRAIGPVCRRAPRMGKRYAALMKAFKMTGAPRKRWRLGAMRRVAFLCIALGRAAQRRAAEFRTSDNPLIGRSVRLRDEHGSLSAGREGHIVGEWKGHANVDFAGRVVNVRADELEILDARKGDPMIKRAHTKYWVKRGAGSSCLALLVGVLLLGGLGYAGVAEARMSHRHAHHKKHHKKHHPHAHRTKARHHAKRARSYSHKAAPEPAEWRGTSAEALAIAEQKAYELWGVKPCGGAYKVELVSEAQLAAIEGLAPGTMTDGGLSSWESPTGPNVYSSPATTWTDCAIYLDAAQWTLPFKEWPMVCTIVLHEWGHLTGHPHSHEPGEPPEPAPLTQEQYEVMYSRYGPEHEDVARCGERP